MRWMEVRLSRYVFGANSTAGIFCSLNEAIAVIEEGLKGVETAFNQCALHHLHPLRYHFWHTFNTETLLDTAALRPSQRL